jgi:hypothetical protein
MSAFDCELFVRAFYAQYAMLALYFLSMHTAVTTLREGVFGSVRETSNGF